MDEGDDDEEEERKMSGLVARFPDDDSVDGGGGVGGEAEASNLGLYASLSGVAGSVGGGAERAADGCGRPLPPPEADPPLRM